MAGLGGWEIVIIIGVLVLLFGAKRLPDMARSIGQSARVFKGEMKGMKDEHGDKADGTNTAAAPPAPPVALPAAAPVVAAPVVAAQDAPQQPAPAAQPGHSTGQ